MQPGLCRTWAETQRQVFSQCASYVCRASKEKTGAKRGRPRKKDVVKQQEEMEEDKEETEVSHVVRKPTFWFLTWSDTNQAVQPQKMARGLNIRI